MSSVIAAALLLLLTQGNAPAGAAADGPHVVLARVPDGGIQPQVEVRASVVHLLYYSGDPMAGDLYYARSEDWGESWSEPLRVNAADGSAIAAGAVRGGQLAIGRGGRVHVAWMGSEQAEPRGPGDAAPMLYTRLLPGAEEFEPERNLLKSRSGLDGGGTIAADDLGAVIVAWHAPGDEARDDSGRVVWVTRSFDDGASFDRERGAWSARTGCCACCGMRAMIAGKSLYVLYRAARDNHGRGMVALVSRNGAQSFTGRDLDDWQLDTCVMSTAAMLPLRDGVLAGWELEGGLTIEPQGPQGKPLGDAVRIEEEGEELKHPALAGNVGGETLVAYVRSGGWGKPGRLGWRVLPRPKAIEASARAEVEVPAHSFAAAFARPDGSFVILY